MARGDKKAKRGINPFDIVIVLLVLCLLATFGYRIYKGVEDKSDSKTSEYVLTFCCDENVDSLADYLDKGTPVYLSANNEILGYIYDGKGHVEMSLITESETTDMSESTETGDETKAEEPHTEGERIPYNLAEIRGKIHLSEDVQIYNDGVYYSIKDINFAVGSKLSVYTEKAVFTIVVESITKVDK